MPSMKMCLFSKNIPESDNMTQEYKAITMARFIRILVKKVIEFQEIGFSKEAIDKILKIATEEVMRIVREMI